MVLAFLYRSCSDQALLEESITEEVMKGNKRSEAIIDKRD